MNCY